MLSVPDMAARRGSRAEGREGLSREGVAIRP